MNYTPSQKFWAAVSVKREQLKGHPDAFNLAIAAVSAEHPDLAATVSAGPVRRAGFANTATLRRSAVAEKKVAAKHEFIRRVHKRMDSFGTNYQNAWACSLSDPANAEIVNSMQAPLPDAEPAPDGTDRVLGLTPGDPDEIRAAYTANGGTLNSVDHDAIYRALVAYHVSRGVPRAQAIATVRARHPRLALVSDALTAAGK